MNFGCKLLCSVKKTRARTGSRLMSVSARGRVSFFARYRRRPKIGKSRLPPGGVRLFGPLDHRSCSRCLLAAGQFGSVSRFIFFPLYLFFSIFIFHYIRYYYIYSLASLFVSPLYFRAKGTTRSLRRARDTSACIYNMYMHTMERDLQRPTKTESGQRDVDFPELYCRKGLIFQEPSSSGESL